MRHGRYQELENTSTCRTYSTIAENVRPYIIFRVCVLCIGNHCQFLVLITGLKYYTGLERLETLYRLERLEILYILESVDRGGRQLEFGLNSQWGLGLPDINP